MITPNIKFYIRKPYIKDNEEVGLIECRVTWRTCQQGFFLSTKLIAPTNNFNKGETKDTHIQDKLNEIKGFINKLFQNADYLSIELTKDYVRTNVAKHIDPKSNTEVKIKKKYAQFKGERANEWYSNRKESYP